MPRKQSAINTQNSTAKSKIARSRDLFTEDRQSTQNSHLLGFATNACTRFAPRAIAIMVTVLIATMAMSCSTKKVDEVAANTRQMPDTHPKHAAQTLSQLAPYIPVDFDWIAVSGYVSASNAIDNFRHYDVIAQKDIDSTLSDLGKHYKLDPSNPNDYFNDGMNLNSGFAVGAANGEFFAIASIDERNLFLKWFDTLTNEEFGRPSYRHAQYGDRTYTAIDVLDREFACLYVSDDIAVIAAKLPKTESNSSICDALNNILDAERPHLSHDDVESFSTALAQSPIGIIARPPSIASLAPNGKNIAAKVGEYVDNATIGIDLSKDSAQIDLTATWQQKLIAGAPIGAAIATLAIDEAPSLRLTETAPTAQITASIDSAALEALALTFIGERERKKYDDIKGKLTQKLLKIDVADQVIHNIATISAIWFGNDIRRPAIGIAMKSPQKSNAFFAKLNILKRAISSDKISITLEDGILHAAMEQFHAAYAKGVIAIAFDDETYATAKQLFPNGAAQDGDGADKTVANPPILEGNIALQPWLSAISSDTTPIFKTIDMASTQSEKQMKISLKFK